MMDIKEALKQWHGTGGLNVFECICTLAEAYAAEHPADDDKPITPEWLESVGLRSSDAFHDRHAIGEYFFLVRADSHR